MRDKQLRPDAYAKAEEELKVLLADVITAVQNGMDIDTATKTAYEKIYQSADTSFNYDEQFHLIPVIEIFPLSEWKCLQSQGNCYWRLP